MRLRVRTDGRDLSIHELTAQVVHIGRNPEADVCIDLAVGPSVSWNHARIELLSDGPYLCDQSSTNGTFLNGQRIQQAAVLQVGDRILLGQRGPEITLEAITCSNKESPRPAATIRQSRVSLTEDASESDAEFALRLPTSRTLAPSAFPTSRAFAAVALFVGSVVGIAAFIYHTDNERGADAAATPTPDDNSFAEQAASERASPAASRPVAASADGSLAAKAQSVLMRNCHACHGAEGSNEGGFNFVLSPSAMIAHKHIVPGDAVNSMLFDRVRQQEMPPAGNSPIPTLEEIEVLREWIESGAFDFSEPIRRDFIRDDDIVAILNGDLQASRERDRAYLRYFTLAHLYNAGVGEDELQTYRNALAKVINSLSWSREIVVPRPIDAARTVFRIDLRDYEWSIRTWERIVAANPYAVVYQSETARHCYNLAESDIPCVRADWFVASASRPPLYESILRLPDSDSALEAMLRVNVEQNIRQQNVHRAGFNASGVSQNNRLIERHRSPHGAYWKSYDFASSVGQQNLFEHPLGPASTLSAGIRSQPFVHAGGEIIFNLPNGLQAYMLVDGEGARITHGPTSIVSDPKQLDRAVVNGISCMSCHYSGIIRKADEIREHVLRNREAYPEADHILALYSERDQIQSLMDEDSERFQQAVAKSGNAITESGEPVVNMARRFESDLDVRLAASEMGMTPSEFTEALQAAPQLRRVLGSLLVPSGTIKRTVYVQVFGDAVTAFELEVFRPARRSQ